MDYCEPKTASNASPAGSMDNFPTREMIEAADAKQIISWLKLLPSPRNDEERQISSHILARYAESIGVDVRQLTYFFD